MEKNGEKLYSIGAFAKLTAVTERTLRFYDRKGLLKPSSRNEHGHRFYSEQDLFQLQKILTLKYLDFSLEEIEQYLQKHDEDFRHTLESQHELLLRKKKQLDQVLETIERMQYVVQDAGEMDTNLLLTFIHFVQHEESQREWLLGQLPASLVDVIFMEGKSKEERREFERQVTACIVKLKQYYKEGRPPNDPIVVACGIRMVELCESILSPLVNQLSEEDLALFAGTAPNSEPLDPVLFPNFFTAEEEDYMKEVFEQFENLEWLQKIREEIGEDGQGEE